MENMVKKDMLSFKSTTLKDIYFSFQDHLILVEYNPSQ